MRIADALAPFFEVLVGVLVVLLVGTILLADRRSTGLRRAGIALLSSAFVLYLLFDGLVAIFFRATRSVEAEVAGRLYQGMVQSWSGYAAVMTLAGAALVVGSLVLRR
jgi:hypothetical protein